MSADSFPAKIREDLLQRIREVAGSTATTELWCEAAQMLLYDCRDYIIDRENVGRRYVTPLYCDEPGGSHGLDSR